jgi:hypothetical protein
MNTLLLQEILVGVLVVGCALFSTWRLASVRLRLRTLDALSALPAVGHAAWLARLRERTLAQLTGVCGGCAQGATRGAASRNRTPGALRR